MTEQHGLESETVIDFILCLGVLNIGLLIYVTYVTTCVLYSIFKKP